MGLKLDWHCLLAGISIVKRNRISWRGQWSSVTGVLERVLFFHQKRIKVQRSSRYLVHLSSFLLINALCRLLPHFCRLNECHMSMSLISENISSDVRGYLFQSGNVILNPFRWISSDLMSIFTYTGSVSEIWTQRLDPDFLSIRMIKIVSLSYERNYIPTSKLFL